MTPVYYFSSKKEIEYQCPVVKYVDVCWSNLACTLTSVSFEMKIFYIAPALLKYKGKLAVKEGIRKVVHFRAWKACFLYFIRNGEKRALFEVEPVSMTLGFCDCLYQPCYHEGCVLLHFL